MRQRNVPVLPWLRGRHRLRADADGGGPAGRYLADFARRIPLDVPLSLDGANLMYRWGQWITGVGALSALVGFILLAISGQKRDEAAAEEKQVAASENQGLKASVALADKKAADAQHALDRLTQQATARRLTTVQRNEIVASLKSHFRKVTIYSSVSTEANTFANDLAGAFEAAGAKVEHDTSMPPLPPGIMLRSTDPGAQLIADVLGRLAIAVKLAEKSNAFYGAARGYPCLTVGDREPL